ncbi:MAG TPA: ABC transporter substrate-binding protein [Acidimicrobiia bacterium]|nr:ABC transporter substrate-binding protein [Acidimicrobiia bacterium]
MIKALRVLALVVLIAACGGDSDAADETPATIIDATSTVAATTTTAVPTTTTAGPTTTTGAETPGFPVTLVSAAGEVTLDEPAQRIAALSATHVEMLFAIGAGDQVIAGDLFSNHPADAVGLQNIDSFNLSVESVVALDPDLVVLTFDPVEAIPALQAVGIPTLLFGTAPTMDDVFEQIAALGAATGNSAPAETLITQMQADIAEIVDIVGAAGSGVTYYHETDPFSFYTPNSSSFIGQLYGLFGMENIADAAPDEFSSGFPQLSPEYIIESNPERIFLAAFGESLETLQERDGWNTMTAVAAGNVTTLDPDVASRWGPRVVELLGAIADALIAP